MKKLQTIKIFLVNLHRINFGPQHPSAHGVLKLIIEVCGKRIMKVIAHITYIKRFKGTNKLIESLIQNKTRYSRNKKDLLKDNLIYSFNILPLILFSNFYERIVAFLNLWPVLQWVTSLITLVIMYWYIGAWYNKRLIKEGGWITVKARISIILLDLMINFALGLYYLDYRDTVMGTLMIKCPIAISPIIFIIEFVLFVYYYKTFVLNKKVK